MKKALAIITLLCAIITLSNCKPPAPTSSPDNKETYVIAKKIYTRGKNRIEYPQVTGMSDEIKEAEINQLILSDMIYRAIEEPSGAEEASVLEATQNLDYEITLQTSNFLSIVYKGTFEREGAAFPTNVILATTIDIKKIKRMHLTDFVTVDKNFMDKIKNSTLVSSSAMEDGETIDKATLLQILTEDLQETNELQYEFIQEGLAGGYSYCNFFLSAEMLYITYPIAHGYGDYIVVGVMPYSTNTAT